MALNPFFLQGSPSEQRLVQDLVNEHLRIYGIEVTYIPRQFVRKESIIEEVTASRFNDNFLLEVYLNTYDGHSGAGDILTKFGVSLRDELNIVVSKERFEDFVTPLVDQFYDEIEELDRPREGDLIYFPLGKRLFEVKFVEHEKPFYQLGKNYVYELTCELFEYEDEYINTTVSEIDETVKDQGYISTINLIGIGRTAIVEPILATGYIKKIYLNNDGYGYTEPPVVSISSAPLGGINATAVATIKQKLGVYSIDKILLSNAGIGYTIPPTITITGGNGAGAAVTCSIENNSHGVVSFNFLDRGNGYSVSPIVTINPPSGIGNTALAIANVGPDQTITSIYLLDAGSGYTTGIPTVTIAAPPVLTGFGNYLYNETVTGSISQTKAGVKDWDAQNNILKVSFVNSSDGFYPGEVVVGGLSSARYSVLDYENMNLYDKYAQNNQIEQEADQIIDFSVSNPFGNY